MYLFRKRSQRVGFVCKSILRMKNSIVVLLLITVFQFSCQEKGMVWEYSEKVYTPNIFPVGVVRVGSDLMVSSRRTNFLGTVTNEGRVSKYNTNFTSPMRINLRKNGLIIPEFDNSRVATMIGQDIMYYPLVESPDGVMAADILPGMAVVADYNGHRIIYYTGGEDKSFGGQGNAHGQFNYPTDVQIFNQMIYVADNQNKRVEVFDKQGEYAKTIGEGDIKGQASGIYVNREFVVVCDKKEGEVLIFDHADQLIQRISEGFEKPSDAFIFVEKMYIADEEGGFIAILDKK